MAINQTMLPNTGSKVRFYLFFPNINSVLILLLTSVSLTRSWINKRSVSTSEGEIGNEALLA